MAFIASDFQAPATTEIYTLSLHDALPISGGRRERRLLQRVGESRLLNCHTRRLAGAEPHCYSPPRSPGHKNGRSEEHTSELQSRLHLVCRLLLEKKKLIASDHLPLVADLK